MHHGVLQCIFQHPLIILKLRVIFKPGWEINIFARRTQCWAEVGLAEEADFPVEFARHTGAGIRPSECGDLLVHHAGIQYEIVERNLDFPNHVVGGDCGALVSGV